MTDWVCYMITSLKNNRTYIGSTNDFEKRLNKHNCGRGAKYTRSDGPWIPVIVISGFHHKRACLSFESGWKRLSKKRSNGRLYFINIMTETFFSYGNDPKWGRIMDLLYFVHNFTLLDTKFKLNHSITYPVNQPDELKMSIFMEDWIMDLPWPHFILPVINKKN